VLVCEFCEQPAAATAPLLCLAPHSFFFLSLRASSCIRLTCVFPSFTLLCCTLPQSAIGKLRADGEAMSRVRELKQVFTGKSEVRVSRLFMGQANILLVVCDSLGPAGCEVSLQLWPQPT